MFYQQDAAKTRDKTRLNWLDPRRPTFLASFISVFSCQALRADKHLLWFISVFVSKHLVSSSDAFQLRAERYTVVSRPETGSDMTPWMHLCSWDLEVSESYLCFIRSLPKEGIYTLLGKIGSLGGSVVKNPPANAGDLGSIPGSGRSPGEGNGNPLQYSCLGNPMDGGAWWATVHGVEKSRTWPTTKTTKA